VADHFHSRGTSTRASSPRPAHQYSYRLTVIPDVLQGRVNSVFKLVAFGGEPISLALTGFLLRVVGPVTTVIVITVP
jgi:hypothetical protein